MDVLTRIFVRALVGRWVTLTIIATTARALAVLDVEVLRREPRFLGDPVYVKRREPGRM